MAAVEDITYADGVAAWLVRPNDEAAPPGARAGVVLWHWFSQEPLGDRNQFLDEARELAGRGVVCLLPQGRFPWFEDPIGADHDVAAIEGEVARFSAGLDLVAGRADVDNDRLAVVGHDFGAMLASIVAARVERVRAAVLITPTPRWGDWFLPFWEIGEEPSAYLSALEPLDPQAQMASIAPRPVLLQLAERDYFVPLMAGFELRRASGESHALDVRQYDADHEMASDDARRDRASFLAETVGAIKGSVHPLESAHARLDRTHDRGPADQR